MERSSTTGGKSTNFHAASRVRGFDISERISFAVDLLSGSLRAFEHSSAVCVANTRGLL